MKIAISNIAWECCEEESVADMLVARSVVGVEIALTKIWPAPTDTNVDVVRSYRRFWNQRGIQVVALQALLFDRPDLVMFADAETRHRMMDYLRGMIDLSVVLGAPVLVFGSPHNRQAGSLSAGKSLEIATNFFREIGEYAHPRGATFCIEPNPATYGCDFIQAATQGGQLVRQVGHAGFRLHLDVSAMTLSGEDYDRAIEGNFDCLEHFHVSEPYLTPVGEGVTDHQRIARCLRRLGYKGWVSIEMRGGSGKSNLPTIEAALEFVLKTYRA